MVKICLWVAFFQGWFTVFQAIWMSIDIPLDGVQSNMYRTASAFWDSDWELDERPFCNETVLKAEFLERLASTSKWPRNEEKFLASPRPRPRKNVPLNLILGLVLAKRPRSRSRSSPVFRRETPSFLTSFFYPHTSRMSSFKALLIFETTP